MLFHKVTVLDPDLYFELETSNYANRLDPILRIEESSFPGVEDVDKGLGKQDEKFKLRITNQQKVVDSSAESGEGCEFDFRGQIHLKKNTFGLLTENSIDAQGAGILIRHFVYYYGYCTGICH